MRKALLATAGLMPPARCHHKRVSQVPPPPPAATEAHPPAPTVPPSAPGSANAPQFGETGLASWYGHPFHGRAAANGEIDQMEQMTAAHRTLPFNTMVRVHDLDNDKMVDVRITDRGPFVDGRIIDLFMRRPAP